MFKYTLLLRKDEDKDDKKGESSKTETKKESEKKTDAKKADEDKDCNDKKCCDKSEKKDEKDEKKKEAEPAFEILSNPARAMRQQLKVMNLNEGSPYVPLKDVSIGGIIMVRSLKPDDEELVEPVVGKFDL